MKTTVPDYESKATILHYKRYKRTIFSTFTNLSLVEIPVAEINYVLWEIVIENGEYTTGRSCHCVGVTHKLECPKCKFRKRLSTHEDVNRGNISLKDMLCDRCGTGMHYE